MISYLFLGNVRGFEFIEPNQLLGGAEITLYDLSQYLLGRGHDVTVVQEWNENEVFEFHGVRIIGLKLPFGVKHPLQLNLFWKKALEEDDDRVHFHQYINAFPFGSSSMTGTCHGVAWDCPHIPAYRRKALVFINNFLVKRLKKIASCDSYLLRYVQSEFPDLRSKIEVIPNYVKTEIFNPQNDGGEIRSRFDGRQLILFPRNLTFGRGIHTAIDAVALLVSKFPDVVLLIVGDGPCKAWLQARVAQLRLQRNVVFEGHKEHFTAMPKYYAAADIVIIPSFCSEGTSLACLEAMATGKPVVVTNVGGLQDLVIDSFNGLVAKPTAASLAAKIELLLNDNQLRRRISGEAHNWVKNRHSFESWSKAYENFLEL